MIFCYVTGVKRCAEKNSKEETQAKEVVFLMKGEEKSTMESATID